MANVEKSSEKFLAEINNLSFNLLEAIHRNDKDLTVQLVDKINSLERLYDDKLFYNLLLPDQYSVVNESWIYAAEHLKHTYSPDELIFYVKYNFIMRTGNKKSYDELLYYFIRDYQTRFKKYSLSSLMSRLCLKFNDIQNFNKVKNL